MAVKQEVLLESGFEPMNARPHHLTESQIQEFRKQAEELRNRRIITESNSFWSCLLLVVPKK
jgi:hypothetical protein